jgi:putative spermidine/putrescine transport system ATP-binding protein
VTTPAVQLHGLRKVFGARDDAVTAVDSVDLSVGDGEFFAMLGPSGSGKTTVLRMIAGFESPTAGRIELGGRDVTDDPPFDRDVNTVFQDYALFPHMTVVQNVAYGLMVKKVGKTARLARAHQALATVRLEGFESRRPSQLSGGQRQRVALARALVNEPKVLLLDEPLGALDLKLREQMQVELKSIQRDVGITFLFVTHDQEEALTMSDRVAVFNNGRIEQVGTPRDVYERPATAFVAGFVGTSNLLQGQAARELVGKDGVFSVRPEKIRVAASGDGSRDALADGEISAPGRVREVVYAGAATRYVVRLESGSDFIAVRQNDDRQSDPDQSTGSDPVQRDAAVQLVWRKEHVYEVGGSG